MLATTSLTCPAYDDLINSMASGTSATNNWDVIASYDIAVLNTVLADSHANSKLVSKIDLSFQFKDFEGEEHLLCYDLELDAPTMQFTEGFNQPCNLQMPISKGSVTVKDPKTLAVSRVVDFPTGYSLIANVPLGAMYGDGTPVTAGDGTPASWGDVINLGATQGVSIILHFKMRVDKNSGTGAQFSFSPALPDDWQDFGTMLASRLYDYFVQNVKDLDYGLTAVTNDNDVATDIKIVAKSLIFTTNANVLSLYIQTTNSGNPPGDATPIFRPGGVQSLPIPSGKTASLIFSKQFIQNVYIKPGFTSYGTFTLDETQTGGIFGTLLYDTTVLDIGMSQADISRQFSINDLVMDFSQLPFHFSFAKGSASVNWSFNENFHWSYDTWMPDPGGMPQKVTKDGNTSVSASLSKTIALTDVDQSRLKIDFDITSGDYTVTTSGDDSWCPSDATCQNIKSAVQAKTPSFDVDFGGLNFFAVKTLIFPNKDNFSIDTSTGISVPGDLVLVGDIKA